MRRDVPYFTFAKRLILCLLVLGGITSKSYANLMISPTRVVFEEGERTSVVTLLNSSRTTKTYRIELENKIQNINGSYTTLSADALYPGKSAMDFIRFSPRVVTIQPGKYQKIKMRLRTPGDLPPGEYRVHLAMRSIGKETVPTGAGTGDGMSTQLLPKLSFSIPVIVRKGDPNISTKIDSVEMLPPSKSSAKPNLAVDISRTGNYSSYGAVNAYMKLGSTGQVQKIGQANNVSVFTEVDHRTISFPLWVDSIPANAIIQVIYEGEEEYDGQTLGIAAFRYTQ